MSWRAVTLALVLTGCVAVSATLSNSEEERAVVAVEAESDKQIERNAARDSNVVLVSTSDGVVTAVSESGPIWETDLGGPLLKSYQHPWAGLDDEDFSVMIPTTDGSLLVQSSRRLDLSKIRAPQLVERTPFFDDGVMYTGTKKTRVFAVSVADGQVLHSFNPEEEGPPDQLVEGGVLYLGRVDYNVHAYQMTHGGREVWNLTYSEIADMSSVPEIRAPDEVPFYTAKGGKVLSYQDQFLSEFEHPVTGAFVVGKVFDSEAQTMALLRRVPLVHGADEFVAADSDDWQVNIQYGSLKGIFGVVMGRDKAYTIPGCRPGQPAWPACSLGAGSKSLSASLLHPAGPPLSVQQALTPRSPLASEPLTLPATVSSAKPCRPGQLGWPKCLVGLHRVKKAPFGTLADSFEIESMEPGNQLALGPAPPTSVFAPPKEPGNANKFTVFLALFLAAAGYFFLERRSRRREKNILARANEEKNRALAKEREKMEEQMRLAEADRYDEEGRLIVGALAVETASILGLGSHGTIVFKGSLDGRPVAVKRMLRTLHSQNASIDREISLLIESDGHQNVVKYYVKEETSNFVYLALQLCSLSLHDAVKALQYAEASRPRDDEAPGSPRPPESVVRSLKQINEGICHLHNLRIVHRDLKPQNILMSSQQFSEREDAFEDISVRGGSSFDDFTFLISDMGLGKLLLPGESSFGYISINASEVGTKRGLSMKSSASGSSGSVRHSVVGSVGWQAPEVLRVKIGEQATLPGMSLPGMSLPGTSAGSQICDADDALESAIAAGGRRNRQTQAVDIFSLGCIFHYVLVPMKHPFGDPFEREKQIMGLTDSAPKLDALKQWPDAQHLVQWMLHPLPDARPTARECLRHPFFWSDDTRLEFLVEFSDRIEQEEALSPVSLLLETGAAKVIGRYWDAKLDKALTEDMEKYRKYDRSSLRDCLRVIRNKRHHFNELQPQLRRQLAPLPSAFLAYFESRFPSLLMHCFKVVVTALAHEKIFGRYIGDIAERYKKASADWKRQSETAEASAVSEPLTTDVVVWRDGDMAAQGKYRGWDREVEKWEVPLRKNHPPPNLERGASDLRYRTRLCQYWLDGQGDKCPMRKRNKCDFAHGPVELRIRENKRNRWGRSVDSLGNSSTPTASGGEDTYASACRTSKPVAKTKENGTGNGGSKRRPPRTQEANARSPPPPKKAAPPLGEADYPALGQKPSGGTASSRSPNAWAAKAAAKEGSEAGGQARSQNKAEPRSWAKMMQK